MTRHHFTVPVLLATMLTTAARAQQWFLEPQNGAPPARRFHALAHVAGAEILFGGADEQSGSVFGDTWRYDGLAWTAVTGGGPGARQRFAACVDTARDVLLVFGGADANGNALGDTWQFDGASWLPLPTSGAPSPRLGAAMAFDAARGCVVLFGGGPTATTPTAETWELDGVTWTQRTPVSAPSARQGHTMAFDSVDGTTMLFGGFVAGASGFDAQTWRWNGTAWQQVVTATAPPAMAFPSLAFFDAHGVAVLTGGSGAGSQPLGSFVFDGTDWSAGPSAPPALAGRQGHATAYDPRRELVVLFGGARIALGGAIALQDTWELAVRATFAPFGSGCALGTAGTPRLAARTRPQLGAALELEVAPAGSLVLFVAGTSDAAFLGAPLPADLAPIGLPGCQLLTSVDFTTFATPVGGVATASIGVPLERALIGQSFFAQALATDAGTAATSNGGRATIGN